MVNSVHVVMRIALLLNLLELVELHVALWDTIKACDIIPWKFLLAVAMDKTQAFILTLDSCSSSSPSLLNYFFSQMYSQDC